MKRRRPVHMLALVLGVVAAVPSIAAADTSFPAAAGDMTARGNLLVWTPWTGPGRLMSVFGDAAAPLPIPRARFGSVDLGTDARGRTVLVYRSCQAARPRHCAVYLYDFASQRHRRLAALDRSGCRVGDVRISRGTVAFARDCGGHALDGLYLKRPRKPVRRMRGVPAVLSFDLDGEPWRSSTASMRDGPEEATWWLTTELRCSGWGSGAADSSLASASSCPPPTPEPTSRTCASTPGSRTGSGRCSPRTTGRRSSGARSTEARPRRSSSGPAGSTSATYADRLGSYAVSGDRLYYSRPACGGFRGVHRPGGGYARLPLSRRPVHKERAKVDGDRRALDSERPPDRRPSLRPSSFDERCASAGARRATPPPVHLARDRTLLASMQSTHRSGTELTAAVSARQGAERP